MSLLDSTVTKKQLRSVSDDLLDDDIKDLFKVSFFRSKPSVDLHEIAESDKLKVSRRVDLLMHWVPEDERKRLASETVDRVVRLGTECISERRWLVWAGRWLEKHDRTPTSAHQASSAVMSPGRTISRDQIVAHAVMPCCLHVAQASWRSALSAAAEALSIMEAIRETEPDAATISAMAFYDKGYAASPQARAFETVRRDAEKRIVREELEAVVAVLSRTK